MKTIRTQIYADGADYESIINLNKNKIIRGFTTNPSLMRKSGVKNYQNFSKKILKKINNKPVSFEVFSDNVKEILYQSNIISSWGKNVFVKIPIQNSKGKDLSDLILSLNSKGIKINVTAVFTFEQVKKIINKVGTKSEIILSIFAGRIADTGKDPEPIVKKIVNYSKSKKNIKILWASSREIFNYYQADRCKCHIITLSNDLINKIKYKNKNLKLFSKETSQMFIKDAKKAGFNL